MKVGNCKLCNKIFVGFTKRLYCFDCLPSNLGGRERVRFLVRTRDNFTCQDCGFIRLPEDVGNGLKSLDIHHINGLCGKLSKSCDNINDLSQMITLCHKCHFNRPDHKLKTRGH